MSSNTPEIKGLVFDVGGVLLRTHDQGFRDELNQKYDLGENGCQDLVFHSTTAAKAQAGELTIHQLWDWIGDTLQLDRSETGEFKAQFWAGDRIDHELISNVRYWKQKYKTAIISNYTDELPSELHNRFKISDAFDQIVVSAIERVTKPDPHIFRICLTRLNLSAQNAIFVDDMAENVEAARALGMQAILFDTETIYQQLSDYGIDPH